jgi:hypothetical protein
MKPRPWTLAVAISATLLAPSSWADASQACTPRMLAPLDAWLAKHPWRVGATHPEARVDAVCKAAPTDRALVIVAAAYAQGADFDKNFVAALVEPRNGRLRSVYVGVIPEDAGMQVRHGSLRIDTARYDLAPGVRAFGVDVASQATGPRCAEGGNGPLRTLFVQAGPALRPVLASVELTSWRLVGGPACVGHEPEDRDGAVIQNVATTISVASHATNGYADLALASTVDGHPSPRDRAILRYDGSTYATEDSRIWRHVIVPAAER